VKVAGLGFRSGATLEALREVLHLAEAQGGPVDALACLPAKACASALQRLATERGVPVLAVSVEGVATPTQSARIMAMHGTGSVAEAAALVAAGGRARLIVARLSAPDGMATCAMAISEGDME